MFSAPAALLSFAFLAAVPAQASLLCQGDAPSFDGTRWGWVNMYVDEKTYELESASLYFPADDPFYELEWDVVKGTLSKPKTFKFQLNLPRLVDSPFTVDVFLDGRKKYSMSEKKSAVIKGWLNSDGSIRPDIHLVSVNMGYHGQTETPINIVGHKNIRVVAKATTGEVLAEQTVKLFDWRLFKKQVKAAYEDAESLRRDKACGPGITVEPWDR
jgi:hypothetical protein